MLLQSIRKNSTRSLSIFNSIMSSQSTATSTSLLLRPHTGKSPLQTMKNLEESLLSRLIGVHPKPPYDAFHQTHETNDNHEELVVPTQSQLETRTMLDSYDEVLVPLFSDSGVRDRYLTHSGGVRIGRLMEDMDTFSVHILSKYIDLKSNLGKRPPFYLATALVDRIVVSKVVRANKDILMKGHVTWVGTSSVEIAIQLCRRNESDNKDERPKMSDEETLIEATFVFVCRSNSTGKAYPLPPLRLDSQEEQLIFERGESNKEHRMHFAKDSLLNTMPNESEQRIIHDFFVKTLDTNKLSFKARLKPLNSVWMEEAKLKSIVLCQPDNRNAHNKIFGGFLMRQAFELAWCNAYVYTGKMPNIRCMDDILFQHPVEVGSLLYFNSQICFTSGRRLQARVSAEVLDPVSGQMSVTNVFHYTFEVADNVPDVIPKTYHEAMLYLEARRHFINFQNDFEPDLLNAP